MGGIWRVGRMKEERELIPVDHGLCLGKMDLFCCPPFVIMYLPRSAMVVKSYLWSRD